MYENFTRIYRNNNLISNTVPVTPADFLVIADDTSLTCSWTPATDAETPAAGLSYNLQISLLGVPIQIKPGMLDPVSGWRRIPAPGNVNQVQTWTLRNSILQSAAFPHEQRIVLAAVQAVDNAWAGSTPASDTLQLNEQVTWLQLQNNPLMVQSDLLSWELSHLEDVSGYELQVADEPDFTAPLSETWVNLDSLGYGRDLFAGIPLSELDDFALIQPDITHYWRIRPHYLDSWRLTLFSETPGEFILVSPPDPPQSLSIQVLDGVATLTWDPVPGNFVYYIVYSSPDALAPFPQGWQVAGAPTTETAWMDPEPAAVRKFYRVKAVVLE